MKAKREALDAVWKKQQEGTDGVKPERAQGTQDCSPELATRRTLKGNPYKSPYNRVFRGV